MTAIKNNNDRNGNRTTKPRSKPIVLDPKQDGVTHLNVCSRGKTELGKFLSNFPRYPFKHPKYGHFDSVEGFWHWLSTGKIYDEFRKLSNLEAKLFAKGKARVELSDFHEEIKFAIESKLEAYPLYKAKLMLNKLPLRHYFVFKAKNAGDPDRVVDQPQFIWQIKHIEALAEKWRNK